MLIFFAFNSVFNVYICIKLSIAITSRIVANGLCVVAVHILVSKLDL